MGKGIDDYEPKPESTIDKKKITIVGIGLTAILIIFVLISSLISSKMKKISSPKVDEKKVSTENTNRKKIVEHIGYEGKKSNFLIQNQEKKEPQKINEQQNKITPIQVDENLKQYQEQLLQEELAARKSVIEFDGQSSNNNNANFLPHMPTTGSGLNGLSNMLPGQDPNEIAAKKKFLNGDGEKELDIYNKGLKVSPLSGYEVMAGSIIPGIFITGVKSTLPGRMIAQVREDVYDSATGLYLLIPKGAKIIGSYDSNVTFGQDRVMIIWERIIFPGGKSIQLDRFPGTDLSGYAGVTGKINNHYGKLLTSVVLSSFIGAGIAIVEDDDDDNDWKKEAGQGAGEQIINIGNKFAERVMNISPEITIAPGQKFNIIVNSDMILEPLN